MHRDIRGLPIRIANAKAGAAYDNLVTGYLTYRADTPARLTTLLEVAPGLRTGALHAGLFRDAGIQAGHGSDRRPGGPHAQSLASSATPRERDHVAALTAWSKASFRAIAIWESIPACPSA
jgi:hypothetical protein